MRNNPRLLLCLIVLMTGCKSEAIHLSESIDIPKTSLTESLIGDWGSDPSSIISIKQREDQLSLSWAHTTRRFEVGNGEIDGDQVRFDLVAYSLNGKSYPHEGYLTRCTMKLKDGKLIVRGEGASNPTSNHWEFVFPSFKGR